MIVFDLKCDGAHVFEAWFASSDAFEAQKARNFVCCPICGSTEVEKAVMAPNVAKKGNQQPQTSVTMASDPPTAPAEIKAVLEKVAAVQAELLKKSEWVGTDFAQKARAMDEGEMDPALIHGQASPEEAQALLEDGISVMPLLIPVVPPDKQN